MRKKEKDEDISLENWSRSNYVEGELN